MIKKIFISTIICLTLVAPMLFAGGQKDNEQKDEELMIWSFNLSPEALETVKSTIIADFIAMNPEKKVEWQNIPYAGYREKLLTAAAGDALPDIFIDGYNMVGTYYSAGIIEDLSERTATWDKWTDMQKSLRDLTLFNGACYGIPFRTKVYPVIINKNIFRECGLDPENPPQTWSEAVEAAEKILLVEDGKVVRMGADVFRDGPAFVRGFDMFVQQDGGDFLLEDGTPGFNDEHGLNALQFLVDIYKLQEPDGVSPLDETAMDGFVSGRAGMSVMNSYDAVELALQTDNKNFMDFAEIIPPFKSDNPGGSPVAFFDGDMMYVSINSPNKNLAWDFIKHFYKPDNFMIYAQANKVIPIYDSQMESEYMKSNPLLQQLMAMQQYGGKLAATPAYRSARSFLADHIEKVIYGEQSIQEALKISEEKWLREIEDLK